MVEFIENKIVMTRGDSVYIDTIILTPCGNIYEPKEKDINELFIMKGEKTVIHKVFKDRKTKLTSKDTKFLPCGEYSYKCVLSIAPENEEETQFDVETYCSGSLYLVQ